MNQTKEVRGLKRIRLATDGQGPSESRSCHELFQHSVCCWPFCETPCSNFDIFITHLTTAHMPDEQSSVDCRVQFKVVEGLKRQFIEEKKRLQSMVKHLQQMQTSANTSGASTEAESNRDSSSGSSGCTETAEPLPPTFIADCCNIIVASTYNSPVVESSSHLLTEFKPEPLDNFDFDPELHKQITTGNLPSYSERDHVDGNISHFLVNFQPMDNFDRSNLDPQFHDETITKDQSLEANQELAEKPDDNEEDAESGSTVAEDDIASNSTSNFNGSTTVATVLSEENKLQFLRLGNVFSLEELNSELSTAKGCLDLLQALNIVPWTMDCTCGRDMRIQCLSRHKFPYVWRCPAKNCHRYFSTLSGTFFEEAHLEIKTAIYILFLWCGNTPQKQMCALTGISRTTCQRFILRVRGVCSRFLLNNPVKLGGEGHIVELDDSVLVHAKYGKGREMHKKPQWIFGIYDCTSGGIHVELVNDRSELTLLEIICRLVRRGTTVRSNGLDVFHQLPFLDRDYKHEVASGFITSATVGVWSELRRTFKLRQEGVGDLQRNAIDEFLWHKRAYGSQSNKFWKILADISDYGYIRTVM